MSATDYFSKILRTEPTALENIVGLLHRKTGRALILERLQDANELKMKNALERLGLLQSVSAPEILHAITGWVKESEASLLAALKDGQTLSPSGPEFETVTGALCNSANAVAGNQRGFFLRTQKAQELLERYPPPNILRAFGCRDTAELLRQENLFEVWAALRFFETKEWMNETFLKGYEELEPADFEERDIRLFVLPKKWLEASEKDEAFVKKKYHNVSHLKEMGVVFVVPVPSEVPGVMLRIFLLLLHYLHEVPFYSHLFRKARASENFPAKIISYLRGDVREVTEITAPNQVLVIQRYLAKDDPQDRRLFLAHVNPEAIHWRNAENDLGRYAKNIANPILEVWQDLDWVGGFFGDSLVSFNLVDSVMSTISGEAGNSQDHIEMKYRYHHQEALWNKIFAEYLGETTVEQLATDNLEKGYFSL